MRIKPIDHDTGLRLVESVAALLVVLHKRYSLSPMEDSTVRHAEALLADLCGVDLLVDCVDLHHLQNITLDLEAAPHA